MTGDGRFRIELQSESGDAQIVVGADRFSIYDASSKTAYVGALPEHKGEDKAHDERPTLAKVREGLARVAEGWSLSGAQPGSTAGRPAYTVRIAPKDDGGLLGVSELAWDAERGVPLRAAVYAQGQSDPVLELAATEIDYGAVDASRVQADPPSGARVVDVDPAAGHDAQGRPTKVRGVKAVAARLDFPLAAPAELAGLPRREVRLADMGGEPGAIITYGEGLGGIVVLQHKGRRRGAGGEEPQLPQVNIDGATGTELATALGTLVAFERGGVAYTVPARCRRGGRERGAGPAVTALRRSRPEAWSSATAGSRPSTTSTSRSPPATSTATSGRTAPARRHRCGCCSG